MNESVSFKDFKPKSFWEKPEGTTGMIALAGVIIGGGFVLFKLLPFILTLLSNLLTAILLAVAIVAIVMVLSDPRFRNLIGFMYKSVMRFITGIFVTIDPIGIVLNYIDKLKCHLKNITVQIQKVRGQIEFLKAKIKENDRQKEENFRLAKVAKERQGENSKYELNARLAVRKAGRLEESNVDYKEVLVKLEGLYRMLNKTEELCSYMVEDLQDEVKVKIEKRKAILESHKAIKSAMKIIKPEDDQKALFDTAMEYMAQDVASKVGDIEYFMEISEGFINGMDLQNGVIEDKGWQLLEQWEKSETPVLGNRKQMLLTQARNDADVLDLDNPNVKEDPRKKQFANLFDK